MPTETIENKITPRYPGSEYPADSFDSVDFRYTKAETFAKPENIQKFLIRHSRAGGNPDLSVSEIFRNDSRLKFWIPACAGMMEIDFLV
ncbi:hypothetical protein [Neisseria sp. CCUG12390]|uniref:hypothetical protein n=1 Tax=Neisseria sp. CCUG12390 TaxID=3392035 RepID=UPI003A103986